jgi:L-asparaginase
MTDHGIPRKQIALISTGGTIEKTYNQMTGILHNQYSVLDVMLSDMELRGVEIVRVPLMNRDSTDMTERDHTLIAQTAGSMAHAHDGVVIAHGTDTLPLTGDKIVDLLGTPDVPIVLTGAMRPFMLKNTDSMQNLVEALLAVQILDPGVYVAMHNHVLQFPGVIKDRERGTFVRAD